MDLDETVCKASNDEAACIWTSRLSNDVLSRIAAAASHYPTQRLSPAICIDALPARLP